MREVEFLGYQDGDVDDQLVQIVLHMRHGGRHIGVIGILAKILEQFGMEGASTIGCSAHIWPPAAPTTSLQNSPLETVRRACG